MSFHVVVDGGADLVGDTPEEIIRVPINITIGDEDHQYPGDVTKEYVLEMIRKMKPGKVKTSQPSPKQIIDALSDLNGDIIYITISSRLSGIYNSAMIASKLLEKKGVRLHVFDSLSISAGIGMLAKAALDAREQGKTVEETLQILENLRQRIRIYFAVPTLNYLVAGGRLDPFKATLAKIAGIRPILTIRDGAVDLEKTVKHKKIWAEMAELVNAEEVYIAYAPGGDDGKAMEDHLRYRDIRVLDKVLLSPVIVVHAGPGAVSVLYLEGEAGGEE